MADPPHPFEFRVPYQKNKNIDAQGQTVEMIQCDRNIIDTMEALLGGLTDEEWVYWCIDDKFIIDIDSDSASYFASWLPSTPPTVVGLSFCRARHLLRPPTVSADPEMFTQRGDALMRRFNYNNIWLHQFLRVKALRALFSRLLNVPCRIPATSAASAIVNCCM